MEIVGCSDDERKAGGVLYMPPLKAILEGLGVSSHLEDNEEVTVNYKFMKFLLKGWISHIPFDEGYYLSKNKDVAEALDKHMITSAFEHFRTRGYFEGRTGAPAKVDRDFYLSSYPDVA